MIKDGTPYTMIGAGGGLTLTPALLLQVLGVVCTIIGLIMAVLRYKEAKRANDIEERKLEHEIAKSKHIP